MIGCGSQASTSCVIRAHVIRRLPYRPRRGDQRLRERVSSCRALSAALLAPVRVSSCDPQCPRSAEEGHAVPRDPSRDGAPRWLMIGEGGMSSPPPSAAQALERASVKFAVHK
jgi:hypothetical protein